ncbi:PREDICTED: taste receptor type 2 member 3-like [Chrysochloris asiatica]|uniref:Taste receptor type 2 n=1 Tax=Chrysochloris asiatica TaxID=185453 RepID=A0A9B0WNG3_CHRAS|nr:PREDICTED: taste receptor type 2 member 3-like [Chrysochloris asiatica]
MLGLTDWLFLILSTAEFILGLLMNGLIGLVNGSGWFKNKRISLCDFIITSLAISRILLLWVLLVDGVLLVFYPKEHESGVLMKMIDLFWTCTNHLSIWLTTCLGVLYCLKIACFSHPIFLWLKRRVSRVVAWLLLGALLLSCGSTLSLLHEFKVNSGFSGINVTGKEMERMSRKRGEYKLIHVLGTLWYLLPLVVSLVSYLLLILSLGRHTRRMRYTGAGCRDPSTEAHHRAIRIILSFFFLLLLYFLAFSVASTSYFFPETTMVLMAAEIIAMLYLVGHSFILILGNPKLRQTFVGLLQCESGCLKPGSKFVSPHRAAEDQKGP